MAAEEIEVRAFNNGWNDAMRGVWMAEPADWKTSRMYAAYLRGQDAARM
ncbi:hypothetical protein [Paraburkholderia sp. GAS32]